jgi:excinuclease ABC subunit C
LGEARRKALLTHFGSVKRLRAADVEAVLAVPGIGRHTAAAIVAALAADSPGAALNTATGEMLDGTDTDAATKTETDLGQPEGPP